MGTYDTYSDWQSKGQRNNGQPQTPWAPALNQYFKNSGPISMGDRQKYAESQGYRIRGDQAVGSLGGYETTTPLRYMRPPQPSFQQAAQRDMFNLAGEDMGNIQGAADRQRQRMLDQADLYEGEYYGDIDAITEAYATQGDRNDQLEGDLAGRGQESFDAINGANPNFDAANKMWDESYGIAKGIATGDPGIDEEYQKAASGFEQDIAKYEEQGMQNAASMASGQQRAAAMANKQRAPVNAQGMGWSGSEEAAMDLATTRAGDAQAQQVAAQTFQSINTGVLQAKQALAGMRAAIGDAKGAELQMRLGGVSAMEQAASGRTQTAAEQARNTQAAVQARQAYDQLLTGVRQFNAAMATQAPQVVAQLRMQGREFISGIIEKYPETVTSKFQMLLSVLAANQSMQPVGGGGGYNMPQQKPQGNNQQSSQGATRPQAGNQPTQNPYQPGDWNFTGPSQPGTPEGSPPPGWQPTRYDPADFNGPVQPALSNL